MPRGGGSDAGGFDTVPDLSEFLFDDASDFLMPRGGGGGSEEGGLGGDCFKMRFSSNSTL